jgi:hypothetical protein
VANHKQCQIKPSELRIEPWLQLIGIASTQSDLGLLGSHHYTALRPAALAPQHLLQLDDFLWIKQNSLMCSWKCVQIQLNAIVGLFHFHSQEDTMKSPPVT